MSYRPERIQGLRSNAIRPVGLYKQEFPTLKASCNDTGSTPHLDPRIFKRAMENLSLKKK